MTSTQYAVTKTATVAEEFSRPLLSLGMPDYLRPAREYPTIDSGNRRAPACPTSVYHCIGFALQRTVALLSN